MRKYKGRFLILLKYYYSYYKLLILLDNKEYENNTQYDQWKGEKRGGGEGSEERESNSVVINF